MPPRLSPSFLARALLVATGLVGCTNFPLAPLDLAVSKAPSEARPLPTTSTSPIPTPSPTSLTEADYFPLVPGMSWTYRQYAQTSLAGAGTYTGYEIDRVLVVTREGDTATASLESTRYYGSGAFQATESVRYTWGPNGVSVSSETDPPLSMLIKRPWGGTVPFAPLSTHSEVGQTYTTAGTMSAWVQTGTDVDRVTLGTLEFRNCKRTSNEATSRDLKTFSSGALQVEDSTSSHQFVLAPGVGIIRSSFASTRVTTGNGQEGSSYLNIYTELSTYSAPAP